MVNGQGNKMPYKFLENDPEEVPQERGIAGNALKGLVGGAAQFGTKAALAVPDILTGITNLGVTGINQAAKLLPEKVQRLSPSGKVEFPTLPYPSEIVSQKEQEAVPYLKPETPTEKRWQDFAGDVGSLFSPVKATLGGTDKVLNFLTNPKVMAKELGIAAGLSGAGNLAKFAAEEVGGLSSQWGDTVKLGTMFGIGLLGIPRIENYKQQQYDKAKSLVPEGTKYHDPDALSRLEKIKKDINKYAFTGKEKVLQAVDAAEQLYSENRPDFNDVIQGRKGANSFFPELPKKGPGRSELKKLTDFYRDSIDNAYKGMGRLRKLPKQMKEAAETAKHADEINRALAQYQEARKWTGSLFDWSKALSSGTAFLFGGLPGKVAGLGIAAGDQALKYAKFVYKNPDVQRALKDIYKAYGSNNRELATKALTTIDKRMAFEFPETVQDRSGKFKFLN